MEIVTAMMPLEYLKRSNRINSSLKSPLRYPGGKARAVGAIISFFPNDLTVLVSPFLGGGSIEIAAANYGIQVYGYDIFDPLVEFWQELLFDANRLADEVSKFYPHLSRSKFYELQNTQTFSTRLERAAVFYILNRSSFSGATLSGGMSPNHPRFTKSSIDYLRNFRCPNLRVSKQDFHDTLVKHQNDFLYLDPPYLIQSALYGKNGNMHKGFDHIGLLRLIRNRKRWILSYNDCQIIRGLYSRFQLITPTWKYGMSNDKNSHELLIFSKDISV